MKKYYYFMLLTVTLLTGQHLFSQSKISQDQVVGKWKLIKGTGNDFDTESIGSIFEFQKSGDMIIDLPPIEEPRNDDNHGLGTWTFSKDQITMNLKGEEKEIIDSVVMIVTNYDGKLLSVTMKRDGFKIVFEKVN